MARAINWYKINSEIQKFNHPVGSILLVSFLAIFPYVPADCSTMCLCSLSPPEAVSLLVDAEPDTLKQTKSIIEASKNGR